MAWPQLRALHDSEKVKAIFVCVVAASITGLAVHGGIQFWFSPYARGDIWGL
jgi:hypothetical protein